MDTVIFFPHRYAINTSKDSSPANANEEADRVLEAFYSMIQKNIIHLREAYLLVDLLTDLNSLSKEYGLSVSPAGDKTCTLRKLIEERFGDDVDFHPTGRNCIVHHSQINPCKYSVATIKVRGLRDGDIIKAFGAMVRRKIQQRKTERDQENEETKFPFTPEKVCEKLNEGTIPELYNAIYAALHPDIQINAHGYQLFQNRQSILYVRNFWTIFWK